MDSFEIELEQVTFTYEDGVKALSDLNIRVRPGEFLGVLGANGAGKSTLCFLLRRHRPPHLRRAAHRKSQHRRS
jgi:ABC-type bacteriocin/lantibiotic exporter with double-glycine peptidase domain